MRRSSSNVGMVTIGGAYLEAKERIIRTQEEAIRELSTPVLEPRPGLLLLALVGLIDTERADSLTEQLLAAITARRSTVVIIDVTGVPAIDTAVASHLMHAVEAARLMGATGILAGLSTANARTLVGLGIDFRSLHVVGTLADADGGGRGTPAARRGRPTRRLTSQWSSGMRIRLPAGSRTAESRTPYGCSVGSWTTPTPLAGASGSRC